ncbi:MAG: deoxyribodipyrimidine photo-lyase, partial [Acidimicrobiia bacterium]|nr:deoxyribodipyrimidine photo-lyase [Acidimicrobiia bacterium]
MAEIVWFRRDARLDDNPAWAAGASDGPVCALFVIDPRLFGAVAERRRDLLAAGLVDLDERLAALGGRLRVEHGDPVEVVPRVAAALGADSVHINAEVTPYGVARDAAVADRVDLITHAGIYAPPPGSILTDAGTPYQVFTPFYKKWRDRDMEPVEPPRSPDVLAEAGEGVP